MLQNIMMDVAVGMIALFLLASLLVTALQEGLAQLLDLRARTLRAAIGKMLDGDEKGGVTTDAFFANPLIAALNTRGGSLGPSYIPRELFARVVQQVVVARNAADQVIAAADGLPDGGTPLQQALKSLAVDIAGTEETLTEALGGWFDAVMARVSGFYKRKAQAIALILGFGVAAVGNLDAIGAVTAVVPKEGFDQLTADERKALLSSLSGIAAARLPIGWKAPVESAGNGTLLDGLTVLLGWLVTAVASTLGAAFWFDLLNRIVNIRATGPKPETSAS